MKTNIVILITIASVAALVTIIWLYKIIINFARRMATDRSIRLAQQTNEIILNSIENGVILLDADLNIDYFNQGASLITGWQRSEAEHKNVYEVVKFIDDNDRPISSSASPFRIVYERTQRPYTCHATILTRSNERLIVVLTIDPLLNEFHHLYGAVCVIRNMSQEQLQKQERTEFVSTASHEMRTPVASIQGYLELAQNSEICTIDEHARELIEHASACAKQLGSLFQDLLTSSKVEDGHIINHPIVIEIGDFLTNTVYDLRIAHTAQTLTVSLVVDQNQYIIQSNERPPRFNHPPYYIYADAGQVREVITNLFDNAVKYMGNGEISVGCIADNDDLKLFVRDTGPGIAADDLKHIFEKFYRLENDKTQSIPGTGLGLFICRRVIEMNNGKIWADSSIGEGTTFYISFPRLTYKQVEEIQNNAMNSASTIASSSDPVGIGYER